MIFQAQEVTRVKKGRHGSKKNPSQEEIIPDFPQLVFIPPSVAVATPPNNQSQQSPETLSRQPLSDPLTILADSAQAQSSSLAKDLSSQIITTSSASVSFSAPNTEEILTSDTVFPIICSALEEGRNSSDPRKAEVFKLLSMFVAPAKVANVAQLEEQTKHLAENVAQLEE